MYLERLSLAHFRNFNQTEQISFPSGHLLIAAAPNATGKTNFLESMFVLLRGRSWRARTDECVQWGAQGFVLQGEVHSGLGTAQLQVTYDIQQRTVRLEEDQLPVSPVTLFTKYPVVTFFPEDTFIFSRGPEQRRNFLNQVLMSTPSYVAALVQYYRVLKQRNAALKNAGTFTDIAPWTELLITHATTLIKYRRALALFLENHVSDLYRDISGEEQQFTVKLRTTGEEALLASLEKNFNEEQRYGHTMSGPHRDDVVVTTAGHPVSSALSRGQIRSLVIALKLAATNYLRQTITEEPLVLLDDVLSELDEARQEILLSHLPSTGQILITCTHIPKTIQKRSDAHFLDLRAILQPQHTVPITEENEQPIRV